MRWGSHDVPSWSLRPWPGPRLRGAGRAHGACGKAVAAAGRGAQAWSGRKRGLARNQLRDSLGWPTGGAVATPAVRSLLWALGIFVVFAPLTVRVYRRRT